MAKKEPKANIMIAERGQRFVAIKDCHINKCIKEGEEVPFSPGQEVPLNLVRLVGGATSEEEDTPQQDTALDDDQQQGLEPGSESDAANDLVPDSENDAAGPTFQA